MNQVEGDEIYAIDDDGKRIASDLKLRHRKFRSEEPMYVKAYLDDLRKILSVNRGDIAVLIELMKYMRYDNVVDITPRIKERVYTEIGHGTQQTVGNSISKLKKSFLILPFGRGSYLIDPKLFAKGGWADILKISMKITYNKDGSKHIKTEFEKEPSPEVPVNNDFETEK
jgi:hypothetical protein